MFSFILQIVKAILIRLAATGAFAYLNPWLLKLDKWCEDKLHIDLIKQEKKFFEKYPAIEQRLKNVEENSHPCRELDEMAGFSNLMKRIEVLEKKQ